MDRSSLVVRIGGIHAEPGLAATMSREVNGLLATDDQRPPRAFPGAQPVSFSRKHLRELTLQDYYVCEKTDGIRYLMYMTETNIPGEGAAYFIDRKNDYYFVPNLHFPVPDDSSFSRIHTKTILDGELVLENSGTPEEVIKFLVFDCLIVDGKSLLKRELNKRLAYFKDLVLKPYRNMFKSQPDRPRSLIMEDKNTEFSYATEKMFKEIIPKVKRVHGNDGLIFTCRTTPYKMGTDEHILKWKPPDENTIDFLLHIVWQEYPPPHDDPERSPIPDYDALPASFELWKFAGGRDDYIQHSTMHVDESEWREFKSWGVPLQDAIVECKFEHPPDGPPRWRFYRLRDDKANGNHISVVDKVLDSIEDGITEQELIAAQAGIRDAWKRRNHGSGPPGAGGGGAGAGRPVPPGGGRQPGLGERRASEMTNGA